VAETASRAVAESAVLEAISDALAGELPAGTALRADHDLQADLALDSLALLTLVVALEDRFLVTLADTDAADVRTAGDLAALVARRTGESR
jgi:acyl carrier protein